MTMNQHEGTYSAATGWPTDARLHDFISGWIIDQTSLDPEFP